MSFGPAISLVSSDGVQTRGICPTCFPASIHHALQAKLLRVREDRHVTRLGGQNRIPGNVRLRLELYYRLKVFQISIAPLCKPRRFGRSCPPLYRREQLRRMQGSRRAELRMPRGSKSLFLAGERSRTSQRASAGRDDAGARPAHGSGSARGRFQGAS